MPTMVTRIGQLMRAWQNDLPTHLYLDQAVDINLGSPVKEKIHGLQALSLQLTYDNLMIVIHRPLLADQVHGSSRNQIPTPSHLVNPLRNQSPSVESERIHNTSFRQCLDSALRISKVQESKRNLLALARNTHLVSFLGMNLFTSSVVLFICALSDILSNIAQEAKRGMARNLKLLKLLSGDGSLSMQCSIILEDLVQHIVDKEKEEMLCALPTDDEIATFLPTRRNSYVDNRLDTSNVDISLELSGRTNEMPQQSHEGIYKDASGGGESAMHKAMSSLHEGIVNPSFTQVDILTYLHSVFRDVATPRAQPPTDNLNTTRAHQQRLQHSMMSQMQQAQTRNEYPGFIFDGSNLNTEDLGQFWLWNMEPYTEEGFTGW